MGTIGIGPQALELAAESLQAGDVDVYGRFDFIYDGQGGPAKMLEYNADTPTGLIEAAVAQWFWLQDVFPGKDQWNGIHEALIRQWKKVQYRTGMSTLHIAHSEVEESGEDWMTAAYMRDVASQAGWTTIGINMSDIGWDPNLNRFVDLDNFMISTIFKLYPWELMMKEPFGHRLLERSHNPRWVEPAWKMLLSNKALLAALWHLYPGHPNLLPAYLNTSGPLLSYIRKPLLGREGASMEIVTPRGSQATAGGYGAEGFVYQEFVPLPDFEGQHPVLGAWMVGTESAGLGIRETSGLITDDTSSFVPHRISR
jgi:glutathionylspermidine synthase